MSNDPVETTDGRSLKQKISDDLRGQIHSGQLAEGARIPALPKLRESYRTREGKPPSEGTVRDAIAVLVGEGLIETRQGEGTFVKKRPPIRRHSTGRYKRSVWGGANPQRILDAEASQQGRAVQQDTDTALVRAPAWVARWLDGVEEGELVHLRARVTRLDGIINQSLDSYFSQRTAERNPAILAGEGPGGHIARIDAVSRVIAVDENEITARPPTGPEAARLEIPPGVSVIDLIRTYITEEGVLDVTRFIMRGDMVRLNSHTEVDD